MTAARALAPHQIQKNFLREMTQSLPTVYRPSDYDHAVSLDEVARKDIDAIIEEMKAAGVRRFVGGLRPPANARSIRGPNNRETETTGGPLLPKTDYVDGFRVLECGNMDEALTWGRKAALACRASVLWSICNLEEMDN